LAAFDQDQGTERRLRRKFLQFQQGGSDMPFDAMMLSLAVTVVFLGFAAVLAWADRQTSGLPLRRKAA
ncbi:hypothetical protein, partial [Bradyrhizobium sp.]|uniref:hypothetical protein n=1 Tax=Bradyrhizobium sp. TaxID=376 RepID=UPI0025B7C324